MLLSARAVVRPAMPAQLEYWVMPAQLEYWVSNTENAGCGLVGKRWRVDEMSDEQKDERRRQMVNLSGRVNYAAPQAEQVRVRAMLDESTRVNTLRVAATAATLRQKAAAHEATRRLELENQADAATLLTEHQRIDAATREQALSRRGW